MQEIYLDNSSTTKVCKKAIEKATLLMQTCYGNPSSLHTMGFAAEKELLQARSIIANELGVSVNEVIFTSGGTESNNLAIMGAVLANKRSGNKIITTAVEHPSVLACMKELEAQGFIVVYLVPEKDGCILLEKLEEAIDDATILVSMMLVNNEVGTIFPIEAVAKIIAKKKSKALLHVDGVQGFGKIDIKPKKSKIDLLTISAHKIHGPKGVGALYIAKGTRITPRAFGGGQEKGVRAGTEAMPLIGAFGAAVQCLSPVAESLPQITQLRDECVSQLLQIKGITMNVPKDGLPYVLNFSTNTVRSETMLHFLAAKGIYVSSGSACAKGKPSHVLVSMGYPREATLTSIRVSFSRDSTKEEVNELVLGVKEAMETLVTGTL